ncbi:uncharacterized protein LOC110269221 [Arachis ipaensis]|uniref:uncharacterized protein LOC110269221 n=1 Tax=Arachis ipaensis TaxID=130454 RepID=UPI000A2B2A2C|nr:uncharacterized protein LOC110269221 [Arachis ipaensis]
MPPRRHHAAATVLKSCYARSPGPFTSLCHARAEERDRAERERDARRKKGFTLPTMPPPPREGRHRRPRRRRSFSHRHAWLSPGLPPPRLTTKDYAVAEPGQIHRLMLLPPLACHFCSAVPLFAVLIVERKCCRSYSFSVPHSFVSFLLKLLCLRLLLFLADLLR